MANLFVALMHSATIVIKYQIIERYPWEGEKEMARFYDPKDQADLARVEALLKSAGIEYFLSTVTSGNGTKVEIQVAEEDIPSAEELLLQSARK